MSRYRTPAAKYTDHAICLNRPAAEARAARVARLREVQPEPHEAPTGRLDRRIFGCSSSTCRGLCVNASNMRRSCSRCARESWLAIASERSASEASEASSDDGLARGRCDALCRAAGLTSCAATAGRHTRALNPLVVDSKRPAPGRAPPRCCRVCRLIARLSPSRRRRAGWQKTSCLLRPAENLAVDLMQ